MAFDLRDRFETTDGSRPEATPLAARDGDRLPLTAFTVLAGGDVFDSTRGSGLQPAEAQARQYVAESVTVESHGASPEQIQRVQTDLTNQLAGNPQLLARLQLAKPLQVDLAPEGRGLAALGYPKAVSRRAAGIFWDRPKWQRARIALRQDCLDGDAALVFHEMGHAVHYLAFTEKERRLVYDILRPTFGPRAAMDEAFAIYTERELAGRFAAREKLAPGVYGFARRQWSEDHLFTRFVRKLYFPHAPTAGPGMKPAQAGDWMGRLRRR